MTDEQIEHFRQRLIEERQRLSTNIGRQRAQGGDPRDPPDGDAFDDDAVLRSELADDALAIGTLEMEHVDAIDDALLRIEIGEYGICDECGKPIEIERFEAMPSARLCADDARKQDRRRAPKLSARAEPVDRADPRAAAKVAVPARQGVAMPAGDWLGADQKLGLRVPVASKAARSRRPDFG